MKPWQTSGCEGLYRFLGRVWRLFVSEGETEESDALRPFGETSPEVRRALHRAIKETTEGIETLKFNTPISRMMELVTALKGQLPSRQDAEAFVLMLSPYAPHLGEELWRRLGHDESIATAAWPEWNDDYLVVDTMAIAFQVMGKLRGTIDVPSDATKDDILEQARTSPNITRWIEGKQIVKEIYVPGRLVNFVVKPGG